MHITNKTIMNLVFHECVFGRRQAFLCVVITVAYMIFVSWVFIKDDDFLNAISDQVDELFAVSGLTRFVHQAKAKRLSLETFRKLSGLGTE